jgi:superfamily II DNA or RNA helicase
MTYEEFLKGKLKINYPSGFDVPEEYISPVLFPFQKYIVRKALQYGKYAIFAECGLGKTLMQVEWANQIIKHNPGSRVLILCPLAVSGQTIEQAEELMGIKITRLEPGVPENLPSGIFITNYEQLDNINPYDFIGVVLDESSILKNEMGKIKGKCVAFFKNTPYKLCCTATPSPNDDTEITNHAEFLNQGKREEILAMYFTHDGGNTSEWVLKGHAKRRFWNWVKTWSLFVSNPADIGFDGSSYNLPELIVHDVTVKVPVKQGMLFNHMPVSATDYNAELRATKDQRLKEVLRIVNSKPNESFIVWVKQNEEADWLASQLNPDEFREVRGSDTPQSKEQDLLDFANNKSRILITKTKIAGIGMNFQNCHNEIFASPDFSFEQMYQAIRRTYRFGQTHSVNIWMIVADTMGNVKATLQHKQQQFEELKQFLKVA